MEYLPSEMNDSHKNQHLIKAWELEIIITNLSDNTDHDSTIKGKESMCDFSAWQASKQPTKPV